MRRLALSLRTAVVLAAAAGSATALLVVVAAGGDGVGLWVVAVAAGAAVASGLLLVRVVRPIRGLLAHTQSLVSRAPVAPLRWTRVDEIGDLSRRLDATRDRIEGLFAEIDRKNEQMRKLAMHDRLTGLPNRTLFREMFAHYRAQAAPQGRSMALLLIDLDQFKAVNDSLGHTAGDELLLATSQRLIGAMRHGDVLARVGADEFLLLMTDEASPQQAAATADRLLAVVATPLTLRSGRTPTAAAEETATRVSASIGIACCPRDGDELDELTRRADLALHEARANGRARFDFFHGDLDAAFLARVNLERDLAHAVAQGQLVLHWQPVCRVDDDSARGHRAHLIGLEALLRWNHPQRGPLGPAVFIELAETSGLVIEIGRWTIERACAQWAAWHAQGLAPPRLAVNVSAVQFRDPQLPAVIAESLRAHGVDPRAIELELTESTLLADTGTALETIASLRAIGLGLVVDDFGTGYSSLSYLKRLKPDKIKIDRAFVRDLPDDPDDHALVAAMIGIARALGLQVVGEGVETAAQRDHLAHLGCAIQQGDLHGRPQPAESVAARLAARQPA